MNDDLIDRLRALSRYAHSDITIGDEAADEIERLRELLRECRLALIWSDAANDAFIARLGAALGDDE